MRLTVTPKFEVGSSSRTQGAQRPQTRAQTRIFNLTADETQTNPHLVTGITIIFIYLYEFFRFLGAVGHL